MFKELKDVWGDYKSYNSSNTLLVDDSPHKSFLNSISVPTQISLCDIFLYSHLDDALTLSIWKLFSRTMPSSPPVIHLRIYKTIIWVRSIFLAFVICIIKLT